MPGGSQTYVDRGRPVQDVRQALQSAGFELGPARSQRRLLLDTFDGRLDDAGLRLEHRDDRVLVLSDGRSADAHLPSPRAPRFAAELAPGPFRARVLAAVEVRALLPLRRLAGVATPVERRNGEDKLTATATLYEELARDGEAMAVPWAVEVDPLTGYDKPADRLVAVLEGLGLDASAGDVFDLGGRPRAPGRGGSSPTIPLDPGAPAAEGFRAVLAHLAATITLNLPGTIDDVDPEFLHDLRVAVRRTRSVLSHADGVLAPAAWSSARDGFGWLGSITGDARDLDVYGIEWADYTADLPASTTTALEPVRRHLEEQRETAHARLAADLAGPRATDLLAWWGRWLATADQPDPPPERAARPMGEVVARRIERAQRRLLEAGRAIDEDSPATDVHELRKDAKRLRYLLECFGGLYDPAARKAFVSSLKALQDNLGTHQDADVHVARLRSLTAELAGQLPVDTVLAAGQLVEQLEQRRAAMRAEFATRFGDYDRKATRRALGDLLATGRP